MESTAPGTGSPDEPQLDEPVEPGARGRFRGLRRGGQRPGGDGGPGPQRPAPVEPGEVGVEGAVDVVEQGVVAAHRAPVRRVGTPGRAIGIRRAPPLFPLRRDHPQGVRRACAPREGPVQRRADPRHRVLARRLLEELQGVPPGQRVDLDRLGVEGGEPAAGHDDGEHLGAGREQRADLCGRVGVVEDDEHPASVDEPLEQGRPVPGPGRDVRVRHAEAA
ncbi:hypothetical protein [Streptomyces flavofungini]|uniref:Uncharacterized protein n=1 Tax=Streptomyces flavofungini TaxID=68200 RepID=A0ABS0XEU0_9ACTN|nr:hypothetical protein [Streptomyces flavofungini]MBJ3811742.1 hypothetical protein [Streptomyces flavofungini]